MKTFEFFTTGYSRTIHAESMDVAMLLFVSGDKECDISNLIAVVEHDRGYQEFICGKSDDKAIRQHACYRHTYKKEIKVNGIIQVTVILFPDGQTYWFESEMGRKHINKAIKLWQSKADKKYKNSGVNLCISSLKMFKEDYLNISTSSEFVVE